MVSIHLGEPDLRSSSVLGGVNGPGEEHSPSCPPTASPPQPFTFQQLLNFLSRLWVAIPVFSSPVPCTISVVLGASGLGGLRSLRSWYPLVFSLLCVWGFSWTGIRYSCLLPWCCRGTAHQLRLRLVFLIPLFCCWAPSTTGCWAPCSVYSRVSATVLAIYLCSLERRWWQRLPLGYYFPLYLTSWVLSKLATQLNVCRLHQPPTFPVFNECRRTWACTWSQAAASSTMVLLLRQVPK